jgi:hypothetical protein
MSFGICGANRKAEYIAGADTVMRKKQKKIKENQKKHLTDC